MERLYSIQETHTPARYRDVEAVTIILHPVNRASLLLLRSPSDLYKHPCAIERFSYGELQEC